MEESKRGWTGEPEPAFQPVFILFSVAVIMIVMWYYGRVPFFNRALRHLVPPSDYSPVYSFIYFSLSSVLLRLLLPVLFIKAVLRGRLRDFGYSFRGSYDLWYVYLGLVLFTLPVVIWAGSLESFQGKYPLIGSAIVEGALPLNLFIAYQVVYFLVFLSGESFWRGYIIFGLKPYLGWYSIPVMVIPYAMSHFGKPFPEAMGAIVAGTVLGFLALRHGNFWLGVLAHYAVALTMDITAVIYRGIDLI